MEAKVSTVCRNPDCPHCKGTGIIQIYSPTDGRKPTATCYGDTLVMNPDIKEPFTMADFYKGVEMLIEDGTINKIMEAKGIITPESILDNQKATWYDDDGNGQVPYDCAVNAIVSAMIQENESLLAMARIHMDERACIVIKDRIKQLEKYYHD